MSPTPYYIDETITLHHGDSLDVLRGLPDGSANCVVTSPPYFGLRDYGEEGQYGLEATPAEYVERMRQVFAEVRRVLAADGTLWLNLGDSYVTGPSGSRVSSGLQGRSNRETTPQGAGAKNGGRLPPKNLLGIPWRVAFALQDDGWILRNHIVWHKPNAMPESVQDRLSSRHESLFLFAQAPRYWFDVDPIREDYQPSTIDRRRYVAHSHQPEAYTDVSRGVLRDTRPAGSEVNPQGRNPGDVWSIPTQPFAAAHFAVMPPALAERCILAGCKPGGVVLDPFCGSGTTGMVAQNHGRRFVGIDLSEKYLRLALATRLAQGVLPLGA